MSGHLYVGTSGFAYPAWVPLFYPVGARPADLLRLYAARLPAVELNNTFYQQPRPEKVAAWLAAVPAGFRFAVKAQRGGSMNALGSAARQTVGWLTGPYRLFGERLGAVLFRVPGNVARDDDRLSQLLEAWPADLPLVVEFQHDSWREAAVTRRVEEAGAAVCRTDLDDQPLNPERLDLAGRGPVYLRLRRQEYRPEQLDAWAACLAPPLVSGRDCYVFFRHDPEGESGLRAVALKERLGGPQQSDG